MMEGRDWRSGYRPCEHLAAGGWAGLADLTPGSALESVRFRDMYIRGNSFDE